MWRLSSVAALYAAELTVSGCAAPATRISNGLQRYGLDAQRSDCVGGRLQSALSLGQLQRLGKAAAASGALTPSDLVHVATELHDPAVVLEVGRAAAGCGVLS